MLRHCYGGLNDGVGAPYRVVLPLNKWLQFENISFGQIEKLNFQFNIKNMVHQAFYLVYTH